MSFKVDAEKIIDLLTISNQALGKGLGETLPQVLIVVASRFEKMAERYRRMAYRSTLMGIGTVFQTMYLVATAMGISSCAVGWGNSRVFADAVGLDALKEVAVGEFIIGSSVANVLGTGIMRPCRINRPKGDLSYEAPDVTQEVY